MRQPRPLHARFVRQSGNTLAFAGKACEQLDVQVLEPGIVRLWYRPEGEPRLDRTWVITGNQPDTAREGRPRDDLAPFSCPDFDVSVGEKEVHIACGELEASLTLSPFAVTWRRGPDVTFAGDRASGAYLYDAAGHAVAHYLQRRHDELYLGFGECSGLLNKKGRRLRMFSSDAPGYDAKESDPLYKHWPFYISLVPEFNIAYGVLYDNPAPSVFDLGREISGYHAPYRYWEAADGDVDCYFIYGPTVAEVVRRLAGLMGPMTLPPRWSLGYLGSALSYTEVPNAQDQLRLFAERCREHDVPCDLFHLSSGYTAGRDGKRYVFTWNRERIPDPVAMTGQFHERGIKVAANVKPCLLTTHPSYDQVAARGGFLCSGSEALREPFWGGEGSHIDFTSVAGRDWWKEQLRDQLLEQGVDAVWNDNNEYPVADGEAHCDGFGYPLPMELARPLQTLLMNRAACEALAEYSPGHRPFVVSRSGGPGLQRYAQTWSGDNVTSWDALAFNIPMGLGLSLSGMANTGHDVGGFCGAPPDPELLVRWVQNGVLHPRFTIHSGGDTNSTTEPWMHPEVLPYVRDAIHFRYRLMPYLYTLFFEAARNGDPIIRPMVYAFQDDPACREESFDFMLGPDLLVGSVLDPGARTRSVHLPAATSWCDFHSGTWHHGGQTVDMDAPLSRIPMLLRAGGIVPFGKPMAHVGAEPDTWREVLLFPHPQGGGSHFTWVEDDGVSSDYLNGAFTEVRVDMESTTASVRVSGALGQHGYRLPYEEVEVVLPPGDARSLEGVVRTWADEQGRKRGLLPVPSSS